MSDCPSEGKGVSTNAMKATVALRPLEVQYDSPSGEATPRPARSRDGVGVVDGGVGWLKWPRSVRRARCSSRSASALSACLQTALEAGNLAKTFARRCFQ